MELQFYVLIPFLYWILTRASKSRGQRMAMLSVLILLFIVPNVIFQQLKLNDQFSDHLLMKLAHVSFLPWVYMFMLGIFAQQNFLKIHQFVRGRAVPIACAYALISYLTIHYFGWTTGNEIHPALFPLLAVTVLSLAYTVPTLSDRILHKNDISYGVYIYHMPIVNIMMYYGLISQFGYAALALIFTVVASICSWFFLEKIAIRRKKRPLVTLDNAAQS